MRLSLSLSRPPPNNADADWQNGAGSNLGHGNDSVVSTPRRNSLNDWAAASRAGGMGPDGADEEEEEEDMDDNDLPNFGLDESPAMQEEDILIESHSQDGTEGGRGGTGQQPAENQWRLKRGAGGDMADIALCTPAPRAPPSSSKTPHAGTVLTGSAPQQSGGSAFARRRAARLRAPLSKPDWARGLESSPDRGSKGESSSDDEMGDPLAEYRRRKTELPTAGGSSERLSFLATDEDKTRQRFEPHRTNSPLPPATTLFGDASNGAAAHVRVTRPSVLVSSDSDAEPEISGHDTHHVAAAPFVDSDSELVDPLEELRGRNAQRGNQVSPNITTEREAVSKGGHRSGLDNCVRDVAANNRQDESAKEVLGTTSLPQLDNSLQVSPACLPHEHTQECDIRNEPKHRNATSSGAHGGTGDEHVSDSAGDEDDVASGMLAPPRLTSYIRQATRPSVSSLTDIERRRTMANPPDSLRSTPVAGLRQGVADLDSNMGNALGQRNGEGDRQGASGGTGKRGRIRRSNVFLSDSDSDDLEPPRTQAQLTRKSGLSAHLARTACDHEGRAGFSKGDETGSNGCRRPAGLHSDVASMEGSKPVLRQLVLPPMPKAASKSQHMDFRSRDSNTQTDLRAHSDHSREPENNCPSTDWTGTRGGSEFYPAPERRNFDTDLETPSAHWQQQSMLTRSDWHGEERSLLASAAHPPRTHTGTNHAPVTTPYPGNGINGEGGLTFSSLAATHDGDDIEEILSDEAPETPINEMIGTDELIPRDDQGRVGTTPVAQPAEPWWSRLPDFVPARALRGGVNPRFNDVVYIDYFGQFSDDKPASKTPRKTGASAGPRAKKVSSKPAERHVGHYVTEGGNRVYVTTSGQRLAGSRGYEQYCADMRKEQDANVPSNGEPGKKRKSGGSKGKQRKGGKKKWRGRGGFR